MESESSDVALHVLRGIGIAEIMGFRGCREGWRWETRHRFGRRKEGDGREGEVLLKKLQTMRWSLKVCGWLGLSFEKFA